MTTHTLNNTINNCLYCGSGYTENQKRYLHCRTCARDWDIKFNKQATEIGEQVARSISITESMDEHILILNSMEKLRLLAEGGAASAVLKLAFNDLKALIKRLDIDEWICNAAIDRGREISEGHTKTTNVQIDKYLTVSTPTPIEGYVQLEAGTYWIGDLRCVLSDEDWDKTRKSYHPDRAVRLASDEVACLFTTFYGGIHHSSDGSVLHADSGTIGIVPLNAVTRHSGLGIEKIFSESFVCGINSDKGYLMFGDIEIDLISV